MKIVVNGKEEFVKEGMTLDEVVNLRSYNPAHILVVYNSEMIRRESLAGVVMKDNDRIEFLKFVGGG